MENQEKDLQLILQAEKGLEVIDKKLQEAKIAIIQENLRTQEEKDRSFMANQMAKQAELHTWMNKKINELANKEEPNIIKETEITKEVIITKQGLRTLKAIKYLFVILIILTIILILIK
mgnify:CR=1 FL=1